uniref:Uncharacterized protein n=1 Tax=Fagus sylvatica TaxID=28930 RepID=A0A2N9EFW9_FAGSY
MYTFFHCSFRTHPCEPHQWSPLLMPLPCEVVITGEITAVSPPPRPTIEAGSSVGVGSLSSEVADFLKEFDAKAPNPHPEQYFWSFNGPLVPFGDFWVPNDCSPYLSRLSAGHGDFTKGFKLQHWTWWTLCYPCSDGMMSTGRMVPRPERGGSFLDSLLD